MVQAGVLVSCHRRPLRASAGDRACWKVGTACDGAQGQQGD